MSFDHAIRSRQHVRLNRETNLLRRFQIDDELEVRRLLHRRSAGLALFATRAAEFICEQRAVQQEECVSLLVARGSECRDKTWDEISVRAQYS